MEKRFSDQQIAWIREQALIYQCACPAQVCVNIDTIRKLYDHQLACLNATDTDRAVHGRIKLAAQTTHAELEVCLTDILKLEGWNMETLDMPPFLRKRLADDS